MENNKNVYIVEVTFDVVNNGFSMHSKNIIGVYESLDDAVEQVMINADKDITPNDVKETVEELGEAEVWLHPMEIDGLFAKRVFATIVETLLQTKKNSIVENENCNPDYCELEEDIQ